MARIKDHSAVNGAFELSEERQCSNQISPAQEKGRGHSDQYFPRLRGSLLMDNCCTVRMSDLKVLLGIVRSKYRFSRLHTWYLSNRKSVQ